MRHLLHFETLKLTIIETMKVSIYVDTGNFGKVVIVFY